jgi:hypothetical protein
MLYKREYYIKITADGLEIVEFDTDEIDFYGSFICILHWIFVENIYKSIVCVLRDIATLFTIRITLCVNINRPFSGFRYWLLTAFMFVMLALVFTFESESDQPICEEITYCEAW